MPHIMYKNTSYGDSPHTQFMEITKAAYDALSAEEKAKDIVYIITDIDGELQTTAENVTYGESNVDATLDSVISDISELQFDMIDLGATDVQAITNTTYLAGPLYARRNGYVVNVSYGSDAKKVDASQWVTLGTLEERFRPASTIYTMVRCGLASTPWVRISPYSGIIEYYTSGSTTSPTNFQFNVTYIVNS